MFEREMTETVTRRGATRPRSPQQHAVACKPTFQAGHAQLTLTQRARFLRLAPHHDILVAPLALPSVDAPPTPLGSPTYPSEPGLGRLITLLAIKPEPDKLPAYLMRELAAQIGADGAYLFRSDAATQAIMLAPWAIVDGAIQHRDTLPALEPHDQHPYLCSSRIAHFRQQGYRVGLTLPLLAGGQTLGFLECLARDEMAFLPSQIQQARALAEQLSLALQFARLIEHAAHAAAFEERQRLAREIHDSLGQAFTAILIQLRSAEETLIDTPELARTAIGQVRALAHDGLADTRRAVDTLRPQPLERFDLATALRRAVVQATLGTPLDVHCTIRGEVYALPLDTALQLLRIAQEALANTLKYADAQHLTIELVFEAEQLQLRVQDDGRGFEVERAAAAGGFGLLSMRARAVAIGAELTISSALGQGTTLLVALPHNTGASDER
jgi:signal transduction histidine kinase